MYLVWTQPSKSMSFMVILKFCGAVEDFFFPNSEVQCFKLADTPKSS